MKKVLITGITGFAGQYLAEELLAHADIELHGTYHSDEGLKRLGDMKRQLILHKADLTIKEDVERVINEASPDQIYNLAAQTSPSESIKNPEATFIINIMSELYLFEAVKMLNKPGTKILAVSTSEVYGAISSDDLPVDEETPLRPTTPYAVSKIAQDYLALQYVIAHNLNIIRVRPFNHTGPRQQAKFVIPMFVKQIAEIEKGLQEPCIKVGNLTARKDFSDVRDIVRGYVALLEKGSSGEVYNIGSGKSVQIEEMLQMLLSFSAEKITIEVDQQLYRPLDTPEIYSDNSKITEMTGWKPEISLEKTLKDALDYYRKVV